MASLFNVLHSLRLTGYKQIALPGIAAPIKIEEAGVSTCSEGLSGTSPQELDSTCTSLLRHQSMHLIACSLLPFPFASMKRQAIILITCSTLTVTACHASTSPAFRSASKGRRLTAVQMRQQRSFRFICVITETKSWVLPR